MSPYNANDPRSSADFLTKFLAGEAAGGILLMGIAVLAVIVANTPLAPFYFQTLEAHVGEISVLHWINDALMAVFFLLVGLEIKREAIEGELASWSQRALPGLAAAGGLAVPALIYLAFNLGSNGAPNGWAIPAATDIAFALGVLSLLGSRVPASLKVLLTALAVIDDLAAVLIIALFYNTGLHFGALAAAAAVVGALVLLNRAGVRHLLPYLLLGVVLWVLVYRSGIHATLAGVILALTIPLRDKSANGDAQAPLLRLEHGLHPWVTFGVIPIFGFANAGISFAHVTVNTFASPVALGVMAGLFVGKQIGVFSLSWIAIRLGLAKLPDGASWGQLYGLALLCGIGFTMSLFIGLLAFAGQIDLQEQTKLGVIAGSLVSAIAGAVLLRRAGR